MLVTDDPEILKRLSAVRSPYTRSNWYDGMRFEADYSHVFSERNEKRHNELRAKMAAGVSGEFLVAYFQNANAHQTSIRVKRTTISKALSI